MIHYQIQPPTRRCIATGRDLKEGERFYSALLEEGDHFLRQDFSLEAWQGPPAGAFSFWTSKVPVAQGNEKPRFDDDALEECFGRLEVEIEPSRINFRYVVALLLVRRKRLNFEETIGEGDNERMVLTNNRTGATHEVVNPHLTEEEMASVQKEVFQVLGWN